MRLLHRSALLVGAAGGLGQACARLFAAEGANVLLFDQSENVHHLAEELGNQAIAYVGDVTQEHDLNEAVRTMKQAFGSVDILVSCVGIVAAGTVTETDQSEWQRMLDVHVTGPFLSCKAVLPEMVEQKKGSIVLVSSHFGLVGAPRLAAYCVAKGGLIQLAKSIAIDYGKFGIRANCLCPGNIQTDMLKEIMGKIGRSQELMTMMRDLPFGMAKPEQMAKSLLFLASDDSSTMTGAVLTADGGYTAR